MPDLKPHGSKLTAQFVIPEAQNFDAMFGQKTVSLFIFGPLVRQAMPTAVEFDSQLCDSAIEIQEADAAGVLAAEFEIVEAMVAQQTPQTFLSIGGFGTELAGEVASGCCTGAVLSVL